MLTIEKEGDIIIKRAAERSQRAGKSGQRTLKTIQSNEERTTVNSGMSFNLGLVRTSKNQIED